MNKSVQQRTYDYLDLLAEPKRVELGLAVHGLYQKNLAISRDGSVVCGYRGDTLAVARRLLVMVKTAQSYYYFPFTGRPNSFPRKKYVELIARLLATGLASRGDTSRAAWDVLTDLVALEEYRLLSQGVVFRPPSDEEIQSAVSLLERAVVPKP